MANIKLTYKAFGNQPERNRYITTVEFELEIADVLDIHIMNAIYEATNLQDELADFNRPSFTISLWKQIESLLSPNRTHTSLSVGDEIQIDNRIYEISDVGYKMLAPIAG
jgi:hypothetical protein